MRKFTESLYLNYSNDFQKEMGRNSKGLSSQATYDVSWLDERQFGNLTWNLFFNTTTLMINAMTEVNHVLSLISHLKPQHCDKKKIQIQICKIYKCATHTHTQVYCVR